MLYWGTIRLYPHDSGFRVKLMAELTKLSMTVECSRLLEPIQMICHEAVSGHLT